MMFFAQPKYGCTLYSRNAILFAFCLTACLFATNSWSVPVNIATVNFDTNNATTAASISGGGYVTPFGTGLHSGTSPGWSQAPSLGSLFQTPTFQLNYDPASPSNGQQGSAVTLGQDAAFPQTSLNERDIILLTWGNGFGLANDVGDDLAIFEAATSEAYSIRVHSTLNGGQWSSWYYNPYLSGDLGQSALDNDTTPTLYDFSSMGLQIGEVINALEITNLLIDDTVSSIQYGEVFFGGSAFAGENLTPLRFSGSQQAFVPFETGKYDPDIQYVVGLHDVVGGVSSVISDLQLVSTSSPDRLAATSFNQSVPAPSPLLLLLAGFAVAWARHRWLLK